MKINFNYFNDRASAKLRERIKNAGKWRDYYAWWPTKVDESDWRWFELIERRERYTKRMLFSWWDIDYQVKEKQ
jgi:hypothetical protein